MGHGAGLLLLNALGILPIGKQGEDDPLNRGEFTRRMVELATALRLVHRRPEARALERANEALDRDWPALNDAERTRALRRVRDILRGLPKGLRTRTVELVEAAAVRMERRAREAARRRFGFDVPAKLPRAQAEQAVRLAAPTPEFIAEEFGRRADRWDDIAVAALAAALAAGLAGPEITRRLNALARGQVERPEYFGGVAGAVLNRARTGSLLAVFAESNVAQYEVRAVLDPRTCVKCRFMHGKRFTVASGQSLLGRVARTRNPAGIARANPFLRQGRDGAGRQIVYVAGPGGSRRVLAIVTQSAEGKVDEVGRFASALSETQIGALGVGPPPYHPLCRCVIVPA